MVSFQIHEAHRARWKKKFDVVDLLLFRFLETSAVTLAWKNFSWMYLKEWVVKSILIKRTALVSWLCFNSHETSWSLFLLQKAKMLVVNCNVLYGIWGHASKTYQGDERLRRGFHGGNYNPNWERVNQTTYFRKKSYNTKKLEKQKKSITADLKCSIVFLLLDGESERRWAEPNLSPKWDLTRPEQNKTLYKSEYNLYTWYCAKFMNELIQWRGSEQVAPGQRGWNVYFW